MKNLTFKFNKQDVFDMMLDEVKIGYIAKFPGNRHTFWIYDIYPEFIGGKYLGFHERSADSIDEVKALALSILKRHG